MFSEITALKRRQGSCYSETKLRILVCCPALHKLGAVIIPATNLLTQSDISYRVNTAGIKAAVCTPDETTAEDILAVASQPNTLETVFVPRRQIFGAVDFTEEVENAPDTLERVETKQKSLW